MVEGAPLLREYTGNGIEGSNPFFSASFPHRNKTLRHETYQTVCPRLFPEAAPHQRPPKKRNSLNMPAAPIPREFADSHTV